MPLVIIWEGMMMTAWMLVKTKVSPTHPKSAPGVVDEVGAAELEDGAKEPTGKKFVVVDCFNTKVASHRRSVDDSNGDTFDDSDAPPARPARGPGSRGGRGSRGRAARQPVCIFLQSNHSNNIVLMQLLLKFRPALSPHLLSTLQEPEWLLAAE
jgi:hypothetical protein